MIGRAAARHALGGAVVASVLAHVGVFGALGLRALRAEPPPLPTTVAFEVHAPPPAPKPPAPKPAPPPAAKREPSRALARVEPAARVTEPPSTQPPPTAPQEPSPPAAPMDLTGMTLTNQNGTGWASATGDGTSSTRPIRSGPRRATRRSPAPPRADAKPAARSKPRVVALGDLSAPPRAPNLNGSLRAHYPAAARREGVGGHAVVRARIAPSGRVASARIVSESYSGFGAACRATLLGSHWSAPLDRHGRPVSTDLSYTCRFRVDR